VGGSVSAGRDRKIEQLGEENTTERSRREVSDGVECPLPRQAEELAWMEGLDNVAEFEEGKLRKPSEDLETATRKAEALKDKAGVCRGAACGRVSVVRRRGHFTDDLIVHQKRVSPRPTPWRNSSDDMDLLHKYLAAASL
jgi:hypothetical protein